MNFSTSGPLTVMMAESNDVSYDMIYIIIRYLDQDSRPVKKWSFSKACPKVLKGFCIALISFNRLPHCTDMTEIFSDSALTGISKHTLGLKSVAILYNLPKCHFRTFEKQELCQGYSLTSEDMLVNNTIMPVKEKESEERNIVSKNSKLLLFLSSPSVEDKKMWK